MYQPEEFARVHANDGPKQREGGQPQDGYVHQEPTGEVGQQSVQHVRVDEVDHPFAIEPPRGFTTARPNLFKSGRCICARWGCGAGVAFGPFTESTRGVRRVRRPYRRIQERRRGPAQAGTIEHKARDRDPQRNSGIHVVGIVDAGVERGQPSLMRAV
jgi:hypothetical protein